MMRGYGGYGGGYGDGYGGYGNMMSSGGGLLMLFFGLLVFIGIILLVIWAVRSASGGHGHMMGATHTPPMGGAVPPHGQVGHHEAVAIAKRRLASGEITPEQYQEIRKTLGD